MGLLDKLPFEPDEELRQFLLELENTDGRMDTSDEQRTKNARSVRSRVKLTGLFDVRRVRHMTQAELADLAGTTRRSISAIENGLDSPSVFLALAIAEALDVTVEEIFYLKPPVLPRNDFDKDSWTVVSKARKRQYL